MRYLIALTALLVLPTVAAAQGQPRLLTGADVLTFSLDMQSGFVFGALDAALVQCRESLQRSTIAIESFSRMREYPREAAWLSVLDAAKAVGCESEWQKSTPTTPRL